MKKILVIGARGMAGHVMKMYLESAGMYEVWGIARQVQPENRMINMDVGNEAQLQEVLAAQQFDVVINCVGILNRDAEDHPYKAVWYNSYFPHLLEKWGKELDFKLIHVSTDCVFSGKSSGGYTEQSFKDGIGYYAQSKALGEVVNRKDLTFRTSIIGPELKADGIGLLHWFLKQDATDQVKGFSRAYWTGVTTLELAKAVHEAIACGLTGLYHLVYTEKISKLDLLGLFNTVFRQDKIRITPDEGYAIDKSMVNTRTDFGFKVKPYAQMIADMKTWMDKHPDLYAPYYSKQPL